MGTVPACSVASSLFLEYHEHKGQGLNAQYPLGGVILQGPIYSGTALRSRAISRTEDPPVWLFVPQERSLRQRQCDHKDRGSIRSSSFMQCPVFIIHGEQDTMIDPRWVQQLNDITLSPYPPWWVKDGGHLNILSKFEEDYIRQVMDFMKYCDGHNFLMCSV